MKSDLGELKSFRFFQQLSGKNHLRVSQIIQTPKVSQLHTFLFATVLFLAIPDAIEAAKILARERKLQKSEEESEARKRKVRKLRMKMEELQRIRGMKK